MIETLQRQAQRFLKSTAALQIVIGDELSGKTTAGAFKLLAMARATPGDYLCVGTDELHCKLHLRRVLVGLGVNVKSHPSRMPAVELPNGSLLRFESSMQVPEAGYSYRAVWYDNTITSIAHWQETNARVIRTQAPIFWTTQDVNLPISGRCIEIFTLRRRCNPGFDGRDESRL